MVTYANARLGWSVSRRDRATRVYGCAHFCMVRAVCSALFQHGGRSRATVATEKVYSRREAPISLLRGAPWSSFVLRAKIKQREPHRRSQRGMAIETPCLESGSFHSDGQNLTLGTSWQWLEATQSGHSESSHARPAVIETRLPLLHPDLRPQTMLAIQSH